MYRSDKIEVQALRDNGLKSRMYCERKIRNFEHDYIQGSKGERKVYAEH